jgi:hypothetical protein
VDVFETPDELLFPEGGRQCLEVDAFAPEELVGARVDVFEQEDLDLVLRK